MYYTPNFAPYVTALDAPTGEVEITDLPAALTRNETGAIAGGVALTDLIPFSSGDQELQTRAAEIWADKILNGWGGLSAGQSIPFAPGGGMGGGGGASYEVPVEASMRSFRVTFPVLAGLGAPTHAPLTRILYGPSCATQAAALAQASQFGSPILHLTPEGPFDGYYEVIQYDYTHAPGIFGWDWNGSSYAIGLSFLGLAGPVYPNPWDNRLALYAFPDWDDHYRDFTCAAADLDDLILEGFPLPPDYLTWGATFLLDPDAQAAAFGYAARPFVPPPDHPNWDHHRFENVRLFRRVQYYFADQTGPRYGCRVVEVYDSGFDQRYIYAPSGSGHTHVWRFPFKRQIWGGGLPFFMPLFTLVGALMAGGAAAANAGAAEMVVKVLRERDKRRRRQEESA